VDLYVLSFWEKLIKPKFKQAVLKKFSIKNGKKFAKRLA